MAGSLNRVQIIGNIGNDPDIRTMNSGDKVANISVATSETWKDKQTGEKKEKTEWHRVVVFGGMADVIERFTRKGSKVMIEGKLQTRKWTDQQGVEKYTTEIVVQPFGGNLILLDRKQDGDNNSGGYSQQGGQSSGGYQQSSGGGQQQHDQKRYGNPIEDDEIPF